MSVPTPQPPDPELASEPAKAGSGWWKVGLRLLVSAVVLTILVLKTPHLSGVLPHHHHLHSALLLTSALILIFAGIVLQAWRWQQVLHIFDEHVGIVRLTVYTLAGQFLGNVLPSTIGGDVIRISRVGADIDSTETAFASVAIERLTGFVALPALVVIGFLIRPSLVHSDHAPLALLVAAITVGALVAILSAAGHPRLAGRFAGRQSAMRFIGAVHVGIDRLRRYPRKALGVVGTSFAYQTSVIIAVLCIAHTLELPAPTAAIIAFVPAVAMAQSVPITIGGLGVREGMLVLLLHPFGVRDAQAVAVGLLWYACVLIVSMLGAPAFAVGKRRPSVAAGASS
jgi:glycosyltransferase 2 family protein